MPWMLKVKNLPYIPHFFHVARRSCVLRTHGPLLRPFLPVQPVRKIQVRQTLRGNTVNLPG